MAEVYEGHHTTLDRPVAVKIMHASLLDNEQVAGRFRIEAIAVTALRHANIVQVYDFDVVEGYPYIVMELVRGLPMNEYLQALRDSGHKLPVETTARLLMPLASALDYAHARNMVHRDIKPANVLLRCETGRIDPRQPLPLEVEPVLTDFGVERLLNITTLSGSGAISGAPAYLSPEQAQGLPVDGRSDIYSLGVMLYEMLTGRLPFEAAEDTSLALIRKHMTEMPAPVPGLSPAVQSILDRSLAKDRELRFSKAGDLAAAVMVSVFGATLPSVVHSKPVLPVEGLVAALDLLVAQARAYEMALPGNNYAARAAVSALSDLAQQALSEARDLEAALKPALPGAHPFSPREHEVLSLAATGLTNKEIAYRLGISERTVQFHVNSIFNKIGAQSRTEAVALALGSGWISPVGR